MEWCKKLILLGTLFLAGCAASPKTEIFVQKNVYVYANGDVLVNYQSNAEIKSDADLEGTVSPETEVTITPLP